MTPKHAHGGIGDLLQFVDDAVEEGLISIYSHYKQAPDIFTQFGVKIERFDYYNSLDEYWGIFMSGNSLKRNYFPNFKLPASPFPKPEGRTVIGVHIEGSKFSNEFWAQRGQPSKNMSDSFLEKLVEAIKEKFPTGIPYFFCSPERQDEIGRKMAAVVEGDFYVIAFNKIWDSLACVPHCDCMIGMDSSIKSMSCMLRIPTVVLLGMYEDPYRDEHFVAPYVKEDVMAPVYFSDIDLVNPRLVVSIFN